MNGVYLKFFLHEQQRLHGVLGYEWLLETAKKAGIPGGSVFRAIAGYGRHGVLHEDHFFELAGDLPVAVEFVVSAADAERLCELIREHKLSVFYIKLAAEFGTASPAP